MKKALYMGATLVLGACVYGSPVNNERFYSNMDITKIDWSKVDGKGSSCQTNWFFGLMPFGNNSVASAVEMAEVSRIAYVDTDTVLYLPLLMFRECTNVYGELTPGARTARSYRDNGAGTGGAGVRESAFGDFPAAKPMAKPAPVADSAPSKTDAE